MADISHSFTCPDCGSAGESHRVSLLVVPWLEEGWEEGVQPVWTPGETTTASSVLGVRSLPTQSPGEQGRV